MATYTLLRMTQLILSAMDSDEVNGINDTVEARQVVDIIETTFNDIVSTVGFPEHWDFFELEASGDVTRPTKMRLPDRVVKYDWLQYDVREAGETIRSMQQLWPLTRFEFFNRMNGLNTTETNVYQYNYLVGAETFDVRGKNDAWPMYYTALQDRTLIFDNYKADIESTLVATKTMGWGQIVPVFSRTDDYVPELDDQTFTYLFNEAKSACFAYLKQVQNGKADQWARRSLIHTQNNKDRVPQDPAMYRLAPNFGRNSRRPKIRNWM